LQAALDIRSVNGYGARLIGEGGPVETLAEVEEAKVVMTEALGWSVVRWLREKKRVRRIADHANEALDRRLEEVRSHWTRQLLSAYRDGSAAARRLRQAAERAHRARMDAEATFDDAEKQLSTAMAREGCRKAIASWELYETAIRLSEDAAVFRDSR